jgi:hypothetical protein
MLEREQLSGLRSITSLQPQDAMHLQAAAGWIELGDLGSANDELGRITPSSRAHPDVLDLWWLIYSHHEKWDMCLDIASAIVKMAPDRSSGWVDKAYSLRWSGAGVNKAQTVLHEAAKKFPVDWTIQYNLACYCALLHQRVEAKNHLRKACALGESVTVLGMARDDADLESLW